MKNQSPKNLHEYSLQLQQSNKEEAEEILKEMIEQHPLLQSFITHSPTAFFLFSYVDLSVIFLNYEVTSQILRMPLEEIIQNYKNMGMNFTFSRMHPSDLKILTEDFFRLSEEVMKSVPLALRDKVRYSNNYRILRGDGTWAKLLNQFCVVSDKKEGKPLFGIGTLTDITEQKRDNKLIFKAEYFDEENGFKSIVQEFIPQEPGVTTLSEREKEVAVGLCRGLKPLELADQLFVSEFTIKAHKRKIFEKLSIHSLAELSLKLHEEGWI